MKRIIIEIDNSDVPKIVTIDDEIQTLKAISRSVKESAKTLKRIERNIERNMKVKK